MASPDSMARLSRGDEMQLFNVLQAAGYKPAEIVKLNNHREVLEAMRVAMLTHPVFHLIHEIWTPLNDIVEIARGYDGVSGDQIDFMLKTARENGLVDGFEAESPKNPLLAPVVVKNCETVPATLLFGRELMRQEWGEKYSEWEAAYAQGVDDKRVKPVEGAPLFEPNKLTLQIVDFGANWNPLDGTVLKDVQAAQAGKLAGFEVIFAPSQHPEWFRQMDGEKIPFAIAAALLLSVPGRDEWSLSPSVWHGHDRARLDGCRVGDRFRSYAVPVRREFNKR